MAIVWRNVSLLSSKDRVEQAELLLWNSGAVSVTVEDAGGQDLLEPGPGETPIWDQAVVTGLFEADTTLVAMPEQIAMLGFELLRDEMLADRPWEREWLSQFRPMQFGSRLWICPTGYEVDGDVVLQLDPGLAFGTGTHPTTSMCLQWLDSHPPVGDRVVDFGCGSGVLAIAASLLGADQTFATDNDPQALQATEDNAAKNQARIEIFPSHEISRLPLQSMDLVLANILAEPLRDLSPLLKGLLRPGGLLVMSGILHDQASLVMDAYSDEVVFETPITLEDWTLLWGQKRG